MNKIPVGQTIGQAYAFAFGQIGTAIGLIWVPTVIQAAVNFFVLRALYPALADSLDAASGHAPASSPALVSAGASLLPFVLIVVSLLTFSMIAVALGRQVLGLREGPALAYVSFGAAEFKVFGNYFLLYGLSILFAFVLMLAAGIAMAVGPGAVAVALSVGIGAFLYLGVRLSFLIVPAVLDGADMGFVRSWQMTGGGFWRIAGIGIATLLPIVVVVDLVTSMLLGQGTAPATPPATMADFLHVTAEQLRAVLPDLPILVGVGLFLSPLTYALAFTPAAFAYRAMTGKTVFGGRTEN